MPRALLVPLTLLLCLPGAAAQGVGLTLIPGSLNCIVNASNAGSAGNEYGFEDGSVHRVGGVIHMLVSEEYAAPKWVGMRLAHWSTNAPGGDSNWARVGTLVLDGKEMISTGNCSDRSSHTASLWSPMALYDDAEQVWFMTYVGYNCPPWDGVIQLARSTASGPAGIGGPYESAGLLLARNRSVPWEGSQGDDSFVAYRPPGSSSSGDLLALYGSSDAASYWSVGLARSASGSIRGPWVRAAAGNPVDINGQHTENPIVLQVAPNASQPPLLLAVYDNLGDEGAGFGLTWSADGLVWAPGVDVPVPGGVRAPMGLLDAGDGTLAVFFNRQGVFDSLWVARFALASAAPVNPPDGAPLSVRPCGAGSSSDAAQSFALGPDDDGTLRVAAAPDVCISLYECDTSVGAMDVWRCHLPGEDCGGAYPSAPAANQFFSLNANGTISYTHAPSFCLASTSSGAGAVRLLPCMGGDGQQQWQVDTATSGPPGARNGSFLLRQASGLCMSVG